MMLRYFFLFFFTAFALCSFSQEVSDSTSEKNEKEDEYVHLFTEVDEPLVELGKEEEVKEFKKKKPKKRVFYGRKTKKGFTKSGFGPRTKIAIFHYLKKWEDPTPYAKYIYWFNFEKWKIVRTSPSKVDREKGMILHGPYKLMMNEKVLEQGIYYKGLKHGRWEEYSKPKDITYKSDRDTVIVTEQQQLLKKTKWNKGWPKESELSYYDRDKEKMKEVLPYVNGELHGDYFFWYKSGKVKEYGKYKYGVKIGHWVEYHDSKRRHYKKRVTVYPMDPFEKEGRDGVVENEWNEQGKLTFGEEKNKLRRR